MEENATDRLTEFASFIADEFITRLEPELHKIMVEKIISVAAERWMYAATGNDVIAMLIDKAIIRNIEEKYQPIFDYIGDKKAREKALRRAEQNGIPQKEIMDLFADTFGSDKVNPSSVKGKQ